MLSSSKMMPGGEGLVVRGRVEIDMRRPFRSVREAVTLFGDKILAGETLKQMQGKASDEHNQNTMSRAAVITDMKETKQTSLENANKVEENLMAHCLISLRQELEETKRELHQMKARETLSHSDKPEPEIEELKFVESTSKLGIINTPENDEDGLEFNKKKNVKFASPPLLTRVMVSNDNGGVKKKIKRKPLVPLIGGLFVKKKGSKDGEF